MPIDRTWIFQEATALDAATRLVHIDSASCWCEPLLEVDETGQEVAIHREVTWN